MYIIQAYRAFNAFFIENSSNVIFTLLKEKLYRLSKNITALITIKNGIIILKIKTTPSIPK